MVDQISKFYRVYRSAFSSEFRHTINWLIITLSLILFTLVVFHTGGTAFAYPYLMLIPVALAAALYRFWGGVLVALVAGLLMGPFMPLNADTGQMQPMANWVVRVGLYLSLGGFIGVLFYIIGQVNARSERALRFDYRSRLSNGAALHEDLREGLALIVTPPGPKRRKKTLPNAVQLTLVRIMDLTDVLETLGPDAADEVLAVMATRVKDRLPQTVHLYRYSITEFAAVTYPDRTEDPMDLVYEIARACDQVIDIRNVPIKLATITGTFQATEVMSPDTVIPRARRALTTAQETQRQHCLYDSTQEERMNDLIRVVTGVRKGLERGEFDLHFQPKICLKTGNVTGAEALIRWYTQSGEMISPAHFMPKVEGTSLIDPVTRFVVRRACEYLQRNEGQIVSVNFSSRNLFDDALIKSLPEVLKSYNVDPKRLEIELTEGAFINEPGRAREIVQELRQYGFGVSLDDFGTGYSSFAYLSQLPLSGLKIDQTFVRRLIENEHDRSIIRCMIDLGKALNMDITVEGIETQAEYDLLKSMGASTGQGYYFARPMAEKDYSKWLVHQTFSGTVEHS